MGSGKIALYPLVVEFFKNLLVRKAEREKQKQRLLIPWFIPQMPIAEKIRPKLGARNSAQVSHVGGRNLTP